MFDRPAETSAIGIAGNQTAQPDTVSGEKGQAPASAEAAIPNDAIDKPDKLATSPAADPKGRIAVAVVGTDQGLDGPELAQPVKGTTEGEAGQIAERMRIARDMEVNEKIFEDQARERFHSGGKFIVSQWRVMPRDRNKPPGPKWHWDSYSGVWFLLPEDGNPMNDPNVYPGWGYDWDEIAKKWVVGKWFNAMRDPSKPPGRFYKWSEWMRSWYLLPEDGNPMNDFNIWPGTDYIWDEKKHRWIKWNSGMNP